MTHRSPSAGFVHFREGMPCDTLHLDGHAIASGIRFQSSFCLRVSRLNACQFSYVIKVCELPRNITHRGSVRVRSNWKPMFGGLGILTNRNKGYTAGYAEN